MSVERAKLLHSRFLSQTAFSRLTGLGIFTKFVEALNDEDVQNIITINIYFLGMSSPASHTIIPALNEDCQMISYNIDSIELFTADEFTGILLHEIGHALNPALKGKDGEFAADDFAIGKGYGEHIVSGLEHGIELKLQGFDQQINHDRISRIKDGQL